MKPRMRVLIVILFAWFVPAKAQEFDLWRWVHLDTGKGQLPTEHIRDMIQDKEGKIWVLTMGPKLMVYENQKCAEVTLPNQSADKSWWAHFTAMPDGEILIAGEAGKLYFLNPVRKSIRGVSIPSALPFYHSAVWNNSLWLGGYDNGRGVLYQYNNGKLTMECQLTDDIFSLTPDGDRLWMSCRGGTFTLDAKKPRTWKHPVSFSHLCFYNIIKDRNQKIWGTCYPDLLLYSLEDSFMKQVITDSMSSYVVYAGQRQVTPYQLILLNDGRLGTATQFGLNFLVQVADSWHGYSIPVHHNEFDGVQCMKQMADGSIWFGTWYHGIYVLCPPSNATCPGTEVQALPGRRLHKATHSLPPVNRIPRIQPQTPEPSPHLLPYD